MARIVLISCVSKKLSHKAKAKDLYNSPLFKFNLKYAQKLAPEKTFILSAKYGLVSLDQEIAPYNETLNTMNSAKVGVWADRVFHDLSKVSDVKNDVFVFLAGERYRKFLIPRLSNYRVPMKGLGIGKQLQFLKRSTT